MVVLYNTVLQLYCTTYQRLWPHEDRSGTKEDTVCTISNPTIEEHKRIIPDYFSSLARAEIVRAIRDCTNSTVRIRGAARGAAVHNKYSNTHTFRKFSSEICVSHD